MNSRQKRYLKLNIISLFFAGMSFISITLAWFAYSGLVTTKTEIDVKAWQIKFDKNGDPISNNIVIPLSNIYPGMETKSETISIKNLGDSDAALNYKITSARILDKTIESNGEEGYIEDVLAHNYPFHINMNLSDTYANAHDGTGEFTISVSWPLDGAINGMSLEYCDAEDNKWGNQAQEFQQNNPDKHAIEIEIKLEATQYLGDAESTDVDYKFGNILLYNPSQNKKCTKISSSCIKTYVIDKNSKIKDTKLTLIPELSTSFGTATGKNYSSEVSRMKSKYISARALQLDDILPIIATDVLNTKIIRPGLSNLIVGTLDYSSTLDNSNRLETHIQQTIDQNAYYRFTTLNFLEFSTTSCIWLDREYNTDNHFALNQLDSAYSKVYGESKQTKCSLVPVFTVSKSVFE